MAAKRGRSGQSVVEFALVLPLMLIMLLAIVDLARIYTTMMSVESAAREAADYGTTLGAGKWQDGLRRTEPSRDAASCLCRCQRPARLRRSRFRSDDRRLHQPDLHLHDRSTGGSCSASTARLRRSARDPPCIVTVTLGYDFSLLAPLHFEFMGVQYGFPSTLSFERDSTFAMTDIGVAPPPGP